MALLIISCSVLNCKYPSLSITLPFVVLLTCSLYRLRTAELFVVAIAGIVDSGCRFRVSNVIIFGCRDDRRANLDIDEAIVAAVIIIYMYYIISITLLLLYYYETIIAIKR